MSGIDLTALTLRLAVGRKFSPFGIVAWSPDGRSIAAAGVGDGVVWLWRPGRSEPLLLEGHGGGITDLSWSPDGASVASGSYDQTVRLWHAASGRERHRLEGHSGAVTSVAFSPDGASVASGSEDSTVRLWDAAYGRERHKLEGHGGGVRSVAWSADGASLASGSDDKTVRLWDPASGSERQRLDGHRDSVRSVAFSPDGASVASGSEDRMVRLWYAASGRGRQRLDGHRDSVRSVAWSPDGASVASGSADATVLLWDAASGGERHKLEGHGDWVRSVAWSPDGASLASGSDDGTVRLWDAASGRERNKLEGHGGRVRSVAWSPDGASVASGSDDATVRVWDAASGRERHKLVGHRDWVMSAAWSPDGARVASGSTDGAVLVRDAAAGRERFKLEGHSGRGVTVAWSPDGAIVASGSADSTVRLWDAASGRERRKLEGHGDWVRSVAWSPDGASVASGSDDRTVRLWDAALGRERCKLEGHGFWVRTVAWSPDGTSVASGSNDETVRLWDAVTGGERHKLEGHGAPVLSVAWSPDGANVASGSSDKAVRVWDARAGHGRFELEGHESPVTHVAWSPDSRVLASVSYDGEVRLWDAGSGELLGRRARLPFWQFAAGIAFGAGTGEWQSGGLSVTVWTPAGGPAAAPQVLQASAKVILAGDSDAGKTCLARRLAEDRYEGGQSSTHGMQVWTLAPECLDPGGAAPPGQIREIFLWDLGGQNEYQLVNQLFLHDSDLALVLFDADRGEVGLASARNWNQRLEGRANPSLRKFLIRSKADLAGIVARTDVEDLRERLGFRKYIEASAMLDNDAGVAELREELHRAIDWDRIVPASRPAAFQHIRDCVAEIRRSGECVVYFGDLTERLRERTVAFEPGELETTLGHLSREGQIVDLRLQSGDRVIVPRIDVLSRYAGAVVQAARNHERGVPALEQNRILSAEMTFPGLAPGERLGSRAQEKTVLEAAVRLMIERGICFDHQGLLIFPTLFDECAPHQGELPPSAPIYYDFNGPIDNIYASLVARLAVSGRFGPVRLWSRYAEFGDSSGGSFGVRRADSTGQGHLDLYFDGSTSPEMRRLFRDFVNDHLEGEGVAILSGLAFPCRTCGKEFSEEDIRYRLKNAMKEIACQRCGSAYSLFAAGEATPASRRALVALKTDVEERTRAAERKVAAAMARPREASAGERLRILHLSDLHFTERTRTDAVLQPILADLRDKLKIERLDYLVVSGDFADRCNRAGFDHAREFLQQLGERFGVTPLKTLLVPGNHDYRQSLDHFQCSVWREGVRYEDERREGNLVLVPNEKYAQRFDPFRHFYHSFHTAQEYPLEAARQFELIPDETGIHLLGLNSAWRVDQFRPERAELNNDALSAALMKAGKVPFGILVWHHAVAGDRKIADTRAMERLAEAGFHLVLHGDVHEDRDDVANYLDVERRIHVVGGGSFGAPKEDRPESTPRLYSLLEVGRDGSSVRVLRRRQKTAEGAYDEHAIYGEPRHKRGDYTLNFEPKPG